VPASESLQGRKPRWGTCGGAASLGLAEIRHYVVSRFLVLCDDAEIIPFTKLRTWSMELKV
jgi:hypothetical protein